MINMFSLSILTGDSSRQKLFFQFLDFGALIVISIHQKGCQCLVTI